MGKIKLNLESIRPSLSQLDSYAVILTVGDTDKKIPIILTSAEALYINAYIHNGYKNTNGYIKIIKNLITALGGTFEYIEILDIKEGKFEVYLVISNVHGEVKIKSTVGEAISFSALTRNGLIYTTEKLVEKIAVKMSDFGEVSPEEKEENHRDRGDFKTIQDLEKDLSEALKTEDFELAAEIRDKINSVS
jgi:bifunctional DNase/RNase